MQQRRELSFAALRELLTALAQKRPVVLVLDDLQWADTDSMALLASLFREPDAPPVLCLAGLRSDASAPSALLDEMERLVLDRLAPDDATTLAQYLIDRTPRAKLLDAGSLSETAGRHPLFIDALVRHSAHRSGTFSTLEDVLKAEIQALGGVARGVLEVICVAVGPVTAELVVAAVGVTRGEVDASARELVLSHLLRKSSGERLEPYHARVRGTLLDGMDPERLRGVHARLARALEESGSAEDPEALAHHFLEAGNAELAAEYTELAAQKASRALAFDRAVQFYERYLTLRPTPQGRWREVPALCAHAEAMLRERCNGVSWELDSACWFGLAGSMYRGDLSTLRRRVPSLLDDAIARGDLYLSVNLRTFMVPFLSLMDGLPKRARSEVEAGFDQWSRRGFYAQHVFGEVTLTTIELYEGFPEAALERLDALRDRMKSSHLWAAQTHRVRNYYLRGCAAVRMGRLPLAARCVHRLERERAPYASALASVLRAGAGAADSDESRSLWRHSAVALCECDMQLHAACARARAGDPSGTAWLEAQSIRNHPAIIDLFAPTPPGVRAGASALPR